jgi:hypothetical protein
VLVDFFPPPDPVARRGGAMERWTVAGKAAVYFGLIAVLFWTL